MLCKAEREPAGQTQGWTNPLKPEKEAAVRTRYQEGEGERGHHWSRRSVAWGEGMAVLA